MDNSVPIAAVSIVVCVAAPHITAQPKLNETAYKPNEDVELSCVATGNPELVVQYSLVPINTGRKL